MTRSRSSLACPLALGGLLLLGAHAGASGPPRPETPWELEGLAPGQSFREIDRRLRLRDQVALSLPPDTRYIVDVRRPLHDQVRRDLESRSVRRIEVVFREHRLISARVEYRGRTDVLFDDMGTELAERFGAPSTHVTRGPMQIGRRHGIRLYLWLSIWTWYRGDQTLTVEGKHYGVDKHTELPEDHAYTFTLTG